MAVKAAFSEDELAELLETYGRFCTYPEAAEITTLSVRTLKRLTELGDLPQYRPGGSRTLRLKTRDVAALLRPTAPKVAA